MPGVVDGHWVFSKETKVLSATVTTAMMAGRRSTAVTRRVRDASLAHGLARMVRARGVAKRADMLELEK